MNDVRVKPIRDKFDGRINLYSVEVRQGEGFVQVAAFSSWSLAHSWAHNKAVRLKLISNNVQPRSAFNKLLEIEMADPEFADAYAAEELVLKSAGMNAPM